MDVFDVIIAGAGPGGMNAAIAAARKGLRVLLLEKNGYPGGMNTAAMVGPMMTFHAGRTQVIRGIAQELVERLAFQGGTLGHIRDPLGVASTITPFDPEILKMVYFQILGEEPGIKTLFHSYLAGVEAEDGIIRSVKVLNKSGMVSYRGKIFIDATGDGDLAAMSGAQFYYGREKDGMAQPMSLLFSVGGVDFDPVIAYMKKNPTEFVFDWNCDPENYLAVSGFFDRVKQAREKGDLTLPRDRVLFFQGMRPGEITVNMTRVPGLSGIDGEALSQAETLAHHQVLEALRFFRAWLPGFSRCYIRSVAAVTGVRESRRILGIRTLETDDVIHNRSQEDSAAIGAFPIDIHDPASPGLDWTPSKEPPCYDIPFGVMVPKMLKNLLVTGRCISASHEALASARVSPTAMALGQAAGLAAVQIASSGAAFAETDVPLLQRELLDQGAVPGKRWLKM